MGLEEEALIARISSDEKEISDSQRRKEEALKELRSKIIKGEGTTGDPIKDFVIVSQRVVSEEAEKPYRTLQEMLRGKEGKQVLVVRVKEDYNHYRIPDTMYETLMYIGILDSEDLSFNFGYLREDDPLDFSFLTSTPYVRMLDSENKTPSVILPVNKYVIKQTHIISRIHTTSKDLWELKWKKEGAKIKINAQEFEEGLSENYSFLENIGEQRSPLGIIHGEPGFLYRPTIKKALVKIGDKNIRKFFEERNCHDIKEYEEAIRILNSTI